MSMTNANFPKSSVTPPYTNGRKKFSEYDELGTIGLPVTYGIMEAAYVRELDWPDVEPEYSRIWRSDIETTVVRNMLTALSSQFSLRWELQDLKGSKSGLPPTSDDEAALDFAYEMMDDVEVGLEQWLTHCMERVSFYGFGWWEAPLGIRRENWVPPNGDPWRSQYNDNRVGLRRLAFREYSSFHRWDMDERNGRLYGFIQHDDPNNFVTIPLANSLHVRYGDMNNPEGLAMMESLYRLERYKRALELVLGMGNERAAGYVKFSVAEQLGDTEKTLIRKAARALLTAQQGNYITEVKDKFTAEIMDVPFSAGGNLLEAIRYLGILKLTLYGMQYAAMSSLSGAGSFSAMQDSSEMTLLMVNAMKEGFLRQFNDQITKRLFRHPVNKAAFPNMTRYPQLIASDLSKAIALPELAQFTQAIATILPLGTDDIIAIRQAAGVLSENLPEADDENLITPDDMKPEPAQTAVPPMPEHAEAEPEAEPETETGQDVEGELSQADYSKRPFTLPLTETPVTTADHAIITEADITKAMRSFDRWAETHAPDYVGLLDAQPLPEERPLQAATGETSEMSDMGDVDETAVAAVSNLDAEGKETFMDVAYEAWIKLARRMGWVQDMSSAEPTEEE